MQEDLISLIGCEIYPVGDTELMETGEIELGSVRSHDGNGINVDFLIIGILLIRGG